MKLLKRLSFVCISILLLVPTLFSSSPNSGAVVLVGGGKIPEEVVTWVNNHLPTGNKIVITCNLETSQRWEDLFGPCEILLPEDFTENKLIDLAAIFINGGDQWQYLNRLDGRLIQKAHDMGVLILGTSAGAMILGAHYFTAEKDSISSHQAIAGENICLGTGFVKIKYLNNTIIDTHFKERNREDRLKIFMKKSGAVCGLGIDEHTALCIDDSETVVLGQGNVKIIHN